MTQEVRITVDADYYCRPGDLTFSEEHLKTWVGGMIKAIFEMDEKVTPFPRGFRPKHRFVNVNIDVIPHDNDRDYTEEDAEKHLNGEPEKKRKTYAEDFFEKFPNAPSLRIGLLNDKMVPPIYFWDIHGLDEMWKHGVSPLKAMDDTLVAQTVSNNLWLKEKPEDADA